MKSPYTLAITFKSNERPYHTTHEPAREITSDEDARRWAAGMAEGMGDEYLLTLLKDGAPLPISDV